MIAGSFFSSRRKVYKGIVSNKAVFSLINMIPEIIVLKGVQKIIRF